MTISGSFERFRYFNFEKDFLENENFFQKLEHCFLVESAKVKNASFQFKNDISEANVKTKRMVSTKWTYQKERNFASNYFIFLKILLQFLFQFYFRASYKELIWCINYLNLHVFTFWKRWSFIWWCFCSVSILINAEYDWICRYIPEITECWIGIILNVSDEIHSIKSLYNLLRSYRDRDIFRTLSNV